MAVGAPARRLPYDASLLNVFDDLIASLPRVRQHCLRLPLEVQRTTKSLPPHAGAWRFGQAGACIDGLDADGRRWRRQHDVGALATKNLIPADWQKRLPQNASPWYFSTIVFRTQGQSQADQGLERPRQAWHWRHHAEPQDLRAPGELPGRLGHALEVAGRQ